MGRFWRRLARLEASRAGDILAGIGLLVAAWVGFVIAGTLAGGTP
ncbi:MAG: hypothetical protein ACK4KW_06195 [Gemmobacter sp.]